jgi:hypothetical protein
MLDTNNSRSSPGPPMASSSPLEPTRSRKPKQQQNTKPPKTIRLLNVNFRSIKNKKADFLAMIDSVKPDIIVGTETWLTPYIKDHEIFLLDFNVYRSDRKSDKHGGVCIAIKNDIISDEEPELQTNCEIVWAKISLAGSKAVHICAYYRHHVGDKESLEQLRLSLGRVTNIQTKPQIWVAGDMNFPGWDWKNNRLKKDCAFPGLHHDFLDILEDNNLDQLIQEPTRGDNTLDLFLTNN